LAPFERRDGQGLVPAWTFDPVEEFAKTCPVSGVRAAGQERAAHFGAVPGAHHRIEERRMPAEAGRVDRRRGIHVGAIRKQPIENLLLVEIDRQVQQCSSIDRCAAHAGEVRSHATEVGRIDFSRGKSSRQQPVIPPQVSLKQIDPTAVECHDRRVGELIAKTLEDQNAGVLPGGIARIDGQHHGEWRQLVAMLVGKRSAGIGKKREGGGVERVTRAHDDARPQLGAVSQKPTGAIQVAFEHRTFQRGLQFRGAEGRDGLEDAELAGVGGVFQGSAPTLAPRSSATTRSASPLRIASWIATAASFFSMRCLSSAQFA